MNRAMWPGRSTFSRFARIAVFFIESLCFGSSFAMDSSSVAALSRLAEQGADTSQVLLAIAYLNGESHVSRDPAKAAFWFEQAAIQGNPYAEERLGDLYADGVGVAQNLRLAYDWRLKAARRGSPDAQFKVATMLREGIGVERNMEQAIHWFHRSAVEGNPEAQFALNHLHQYGTDRELDQAAGRSWFEESARRSYDMIQHVVDLLEDTAYWVSEIWYHRQPSLEKVARDGDAEAAYQLGRRYELGIGGVPKNIASALDWYRRAAATGHPGAIRALTRANATQQANAGISNGLADQLAVRNHDGTVASRPRGSQQ